MEQIKWIEPKYRKGRKEVKISVVNYNGKPYTSVVFYNNSFRKVTREECIIIGLTNTRMYFSEASRGYTLNKQKRGAESTRRIRVPG